MLEIESHPLLSVGAFLTEFPTPLGETGALPWLAALLSLEAQAPLRSDDDVRSAIRNLLRQGGFKPTGRSKPASEYLLRAASEGTLGSINVAVDACNVVSLHSGLPVSVIDSDLARPPYRIALAPKGASYVFNSSGQTIALEGLLCLFDAEGPCANAVKDAQRTKTHQRTTRTLSILWGTTALARRTAAATTWYQELLQRAGARTRTVCQPPQDPSSTLSSS